MSDAHAGRPKCAFRASLLAFSGGALLCGPAAAQETWFTASGSTSGGSFGSALARCGDLDGDGIEELAAGEPADGTTGSYSGRVAVHSGADGSLLLELFGGTSFRMFGSAVAGGADVDGDAIPDLLVSAPLQSVGLPHVGRVTLHSGADGTELAHFDGETLLAFLGDAVLFTDDGDGDGFADVAASAATFDGAGGSSSGKLYVWSSGDGSLLWARDGASANELFGSSAVLVGDLDGDSIRDLAVGAPKRAAKGAVELISGADGSLLGTLTGAVAGDDFGAALDFGGDTDGDGSGELLVGAPGFDGTGGNGCGRVQLFELATLATDATFDGLAAGHGLGRSVAALGDYDGDGVADFAAGASGVADAQGDTTGGVVVFDRTGALLHVRVGNDDGDGLGTRCAALSDRDGDGLGELAFSAPSAAGGGSALGEVIVEGGTRLFLDTDLWRPAAGDTVTATARHGVPGKPALLAIVVVDGVPVFIDVLLATFDGAGELAVAADVPPGLAGLELDVQAWGIDAAKKLVTTAIVRLELV